MDARQKSWAERQTEASDMLKAIILPLCDDPVPCTIVRLEGDRPGRFRTRYDLKPTAPDVRRLIGSGGKTITAIRSLFVALGTKHNTRYDINVIT